jgi:hypothetical protein
MPKCKPIAGKITHNITLLGNALAYKPRHNNSSHVPLTIATGMAMRKSIAGAVNKPVSGYMITVVTTIKISRTAVNQFELVNKGFSFLNSEATPSFF